MLKIDFNNAATLNTKEACLHDYFISDVLFLSNNLKMHLTYIEKRSGNSSWSKTERDIEFRDVLSASLTPGTLYCACNEILDIESICSSSTPLEVICINILLSNKTIIFIQCKEMTLSDGVITASSRC